MVKRENVTSASTIILKKLDSRILLDLVTEAASWGDLNSHATLQWNDFVRGIFLENVQSASEQLFYRILRLAPSLVTLSGAAAVLWLSLRLTFE